MKHKEYYLEYYDKNNRRHFTIYYPTEEMAKEKETMLKNQGYKDIKIITFNY